MVEQRMAWGGEERGESFEIDWEHWEHWEHC